MAETATVITPDVAAYYEGLDALSPMLRREVQDLHGQAIAYVWGWLDALGVNDANLCPFGGYWEFGAAYGFYALEYAQGKRHCRSPIQQCFRQWKATGSVLPLEGQSWAS